MDDVQDGWLRAPDLAVMNLFILKNQTITLGFITNNLGKDLPIVQTINEGLEKNVFYPALHGFNHTHYPSLSAFDQYSSISLAQQKMQKLVGNTSDIFIPPYNEFDNGTLDSLQKLGIPIISAGSSPDPYSYVNTEKPTTLDPRAIYHLPTQFPQAVQEPVEYVSTSHYEDMMNDIHYGLDHVGYTIITLHPQDFAKIVNGTYDRTNNSVNSTTIDTLARVLDTIKSENIQTVTYNELVGIPPRTFHIQDNSTIAIPSNVIKISTLQKDPTGIAVNPITNIIYVTNFKSNSVSVINGSTNSLLHVISIGEKPVGISVNPITNLVYVVNSFIDSISVIDGSTNAVLHTLDMASLPYGMDINPKLNLIYTIDPSSSSVKIIDGITNKVTNSIKMEGSPLRLAVNPATNMIYVTDKSNSVSVIDGSTNTVATTIRLGGNDAPIAIAVNPATNMIYVTDKSNSVSVIDGTKNTVATTIQLGGNDTPIAIAVNPATNMIYVTYSKSNSVSIIDGTKNTVATTIQLGGNDSSAGIAVNPITNRVYVTNVNSGAISLIDSNMTQKFAIIPEFNLTSLMILVASLSIMILITRLKLVNLNKIF
jgi:YVTN family beta-propeller protein